jgi:hypothetical protein
MEKEILNGKYIIHSNGSIWSVKRNKFLKPQIHNAGYIKYMLSDGYYYLHRLLAEAFIPNPNNLTDVNHKNEIKSDNRIENLEWSTHRDNMIHSISKEISHIRITSSNKYRIDIYNKKNTYLGSYSTIEEAIKVRDEYIRAHNL